MNVVLEFAKLLPNFEEIEPIIKDEPDSCYILQEAANQMQQIVCQQSLTTVDMTEIAYLVEALLDKCWERIHTGHFSEVPIKTRRIYALCSYFRVFHMLFECDSMTQIEKCNKVLDKAQLIGCTEQLFTNSSKLHANLTDHFNTKLADVCKFNLPFIKPLEREHCHCDVPQYDCPSVAEFNEHCFRPKRPALLLNTIKHWPALNKWRDLNYLLKIAGNRTVPIEIGANYTTEDWSQQLIKIRDFLQRQFGHQTHHTIEYLAQHELFEQVPALKLDICIPDYCALGAQQTEMVDIKAWLGPKGTISPMHYDPKHNLLCQVFGTKNIILAAPEDTNNLYAHESEFLKNTSQINAADLDMIKFPLTKDVKFYKLMLQTGDCLYIPPKWWHYVQAKTESFSVSFWWE